MWQKHEKGTGVGPAANGGVAMTDDGKLSIAARLMAALGRPETVDIYTHADEGMIGVLPGTDYHVAGGKGRATLGCVSASGALSAMGILPADRVARPKFSMASYEGKPMIVVWPRIAAEEQVDTVVATPEGEPAHIPEPATPIATTPHVG